MSESEADPGAAVEARTCHTCGEACPADANWCEACGADLDAPAVVAKQPCVSCSADAVEITDDGWCQICGTKQPLPEDHVVADHGWFAIVSDRGRVHRTNEDAGAVAARTSGVAMVVCDGVSSTDESQHASQNAARGIIETVEQAKPSAIDHSIITAAQKAQTEIVTMSADASTVSGGEPPSCTMVTAIADLDGDRADIHIGWLGDSRAYWIANGAATQLTRDHSWAMEQRELGQLDGATIDADRRASSITRWLGADSHDVTPELVSRQVELPGTLLLCSDGLWNYARTERELHEVAMAGGTDEQPLAQAKRLVSFANEQGGHDNITVAVAHLKSPSSPPASPSSPSSPSPSSPTLTSSDEPIQE